MEKTTANLYYNFSLSDYSEYYESDKLFSSIELFTEDYLQFPWQAELQKAQSGSKGFPSVALKNMDNEEQLWSALSGSKPAVYYTVAYSRPRALDAGFLEKLSVGKKKELYLCPDKHIVLELFRLFAAGDMVKLHAALKKLDQYNW
jgi:hypothetical protein